MECMISLWGAIEDQWVFPKYDIGVYMDMNMNMYIYIGKLITFGAIDDTLFRNESNKVL